MTRFRRFTFRWLWLFCIIPISVSTWGAFHVKPSLRPWGVVLNILAAAFNAGIAVVLFRRGRRILRLYDNMLKGIEDAK